MRLASFGVLALLAAALAGPTARAASRTCTAHVALNSVYTVQLDTTTDEMLVANDTGSKYSGRANYAVSGQDGSVSYFLATSFNAGFELDTSGDGTQGALCLGASECYRCN